MRLMGMPAIRAYTIISLIVILGGGYYYQQSEQAQARAVSDDPRVWESTIQAFEAEDQGSQSAKNAVVFLGGSIVTQWKSLSNDMQPLNVISRGFGGAKVTDLVYFVDRLLAAHNPSAVVIILDSSEFSSRSGNRPKTQQQILQLYKQLLEKIKSKVGNKPIYLVASQLLPDDVDVRASVEQFNQSLESLSRADEQLDFIDISSLERLGYTGWSVKIRNRLLGRKVGSAENFFYFQQVI